MKRAFQIALILIAWIPFMLFAESADTVADLSSLDFINSADLTEIDPQQLYDASMKIRNSVADENYAVMVQTLLKVSAEKGFPAAMAQYGEDLLSGEWGPVDAERGFRFVLDAASAGVPKAQLLYAKLCFANMESGFIPPLDPVYFLVQAARTEPEAAFIAGLTYVDGLYGVEKNIELGQQFLETSSKTWAPASTRLGLYVIQGSIKGSPDQAVLYLEQALDKGDKIAAGTLGTIYETGYSGLVDRKRAFKYYSIANEGTDQYKQSLERLQKNSESLQLFGVRTYGITRKELAHVVGKSGGVKRQSNDPWMDSWEASKLLKNAKLLTAAFASPHEFLAELTYHFDKGAVNTVFRPLYDQLNSKYGRPTRVKISGSSYFKWEYQYVIILLSNGGDIKLTYQYPEFSKALRNELADSRKSGAHIDNF